MSNKDKRFKVRFSFKSMSSRSKASKKNLVNELPAQPYPTKYSRSDVTNDHNGGSYGMITKSKTDMISSSSAAFVPRNQSYMPTFSFSPPKHAASSRTVISSSLPNTNSSALLLASQDSGDVFFASKSFSEHSTLGSPQFNALLPSQPVPSMTSGLASNTSSTEAASPRAQAMGRSMSQLPSFSFPFSAPQLFVNQAPAMYKGVEYRGDEFKHLLFNEQGVLDKVVIPIAIDIEQVYNSENDNNYNRKLLGPLRPVRFPVVVECVPSAGQTQKQKQHVNQFRHMESVEDEHEDGEDELDGDSDAIDLRRAKAVMVLGAGAADLIETFQPRALKKQMRSVSNPFLLHPLSPDSSSSSSKTSKKKSVAKKTARDDEMVHSPTPNLCTTVTSTRQQLVQRSMAKKQQQQQQRSKPKTKPTPKKSVSAKTNTNSNGNVHNHKHTKKSSFHHHKVRVHPQRTESATSTAPPRVPMSFANKYKKPTSRITADELEILARKLIHADSVAGSAQYVSVATSSTRKANYKHPKSKLKREQHRHLLQSKVFHKSENVQFALQFMHSIRAVTSSLAQLMETFSDGLNDLLAVCQEFMTLIVDPLSRQTFNDFIEHIDDYESLMRVIDAMSSNFFDSSQNLRDNLPSITAVLQNEINTRAQEYTQYMSDLRCADHDLASLHVHCDRTLRRLFRDIPKTNLAAANDAYGDDDSKSVDFDAHDDLSVSYDDDVDDDVDDDEEDAARMLMLRDGQSSVKRKKSLIQHKHIRVFGSHYVAANSNERICREVPSQVRAEILEKYIHYVSLMEVMNANVHRCYSDVLPAVNVEFEDSEKELKTHIRSNLSVIQQNVATFGDRERTNNSYSHNHRDNKFHRFNAKKPSLLFASESRRHSRHARKSLANVKLFRVHSNHLMASPMHVQHVVAKIEEYVSEEHEKKSQDEHVMGSKRKYKITDEVVQHFLNNRYYHLGDILYEIPDLYGAFENYLKSALCVENLYFLREIDDIYFSLHRSGQHLFDHRIAVTECRNLYARFIADDSPTQINLPGSLVKRIKKDLQRIQNIKDPISIFDKAYENVSSLIHKESLPHFYKSPYFKSWYEKKRVENEKMRKREKKAAKKS